MNKQTQFCTYDAAVAFCAALTARKIGDGVKPIIDPLKYDPQNQWRKNGIFRYPWEFTPEIKDGAALFYQVHFNNGVVRTIGSLMSLFYTGIPAENVWRNIDADVKQAFAANEVMGEE